jgi:hypothetical protein
VTRATVHDLLKALMYETRFIVSLAASECRIRKLVVLGFYPEGGGLVGLAVGGEQ